MAKAKVIKVWRNGMLIDEVKSVDEAKEAIERRKQQDIELWEAGWTYWNKKSHPDNFHYSYR